jgi:hypothetical protein
MASAVVLAAAVAAVTSVAAMRWLIVRLAMLEVGAVMAAGAAGMMWMFHVCDIGRDIS